MSPFLRRKRWWDRVPRSDGLRVRVSLGTRDEELAVRIGKLLDHLADPIRDFQLLDLIARGNVSAVEVWDAEQLGARGALKSRLLAAEVLTEDPDLTAQVNSWYDSLTIGGRDRYRNHVRTLLPEGQRFPASAFTRNAIRQWLHGKPPQYRASASSFAQWCVEHDLLTENPVRQVRGRKAYAPRARHLTLDEATTLVGVMPEPFATLHALMLGTGMEVSAALATTYADIDRTEKTVHARGTKRVHRDRTVRVTEDWAWTRLTAYLKAHPGMGTAPVFPVSSNAVQWAFRGARTKAKLTDYRIHDHRHTYAVWLLRRGVDEQVIAHQLGHKNAALIRPVYGRYAPEKQDYEGRKAVTHSTQERAS